jgi:hypothetical protein
MVRRRECGRNVAEVAPKFYWFHQPFRSGELRVETVDVAAYRVMGQAARGDVILSEPLPLHQAMGWRLYDVLWNSLLPVLHDRVVEVLEGAHLTGWGKYPVCVTDRAGKVLQDYRWGLSVLGRCGPTYLDKHHSRIVYEDMPGGLAPNYVGLHVPLAEWDGSDVFRDPSKGYILMSERAAAALKAAKVTNIELKPIEEVRVSADDQPFYPHDKVKKPVS